MKRTSKALIGEVMTQVTTLTEAQANALHGQAGPQLVDVHDLQECEREGLMLRPYQTSRDTQGFRAEAEAEEPSPAPMFGGAEEYVLFCGSDWRSAQAAQALVELRLTHTASTEDR